MGNVYNNDIMADITKKTRTNPLDPRAIAVMKVADVEKSAPDQGELNQRTQDQLSRGTDARVKSVLDDSDKNRTASLVPIPQSNKPLTPSELGALWDRYSRGLVLYARQWCMSGEDVVQEALWKLARQSLRPNDPVTWMFAVVRNSAIDAGKSEACRRKNERSAASEKQDWFEENLLGDLEGAEITAALQELNDAQRELIVLHIWNLLTFEQIGKITNQSSSTAQRHYAAALGELKKILEK